MRTRFLAVLTALWMAVGCSGDDTKKTPVEDVAVEDLAADMGQSDVRQVVPVLEDVLPDTAADVVPDTVQPSLPKAFLIEDEADLLPGPRAGGRPGDFRLQSDHIVAIIGGADHAIFAPYGGGVLDLAVTGGEDHFEEQFPMTGFLRSVRVTKVEVADDGTSGEAIIKVTGTDGPIPLIASLIPVAPAGVEVVVEYVLRADSTSLEIRTTLTNPKEDKTTVAVGDAFLFSETGKTVGQGGGYDVTALINQASMEWLATDDPDMSYVLTPPAGSGIKVALTQDELTLATYDSVKIFAGDSATISRRLYPAKGRILNALALYWEDKGVATSEVTGKVELDTAGYDFTRMNLSVFEGDQFVGAINPRADGTLQFRLPAGDYKVVLSGPGVVGAQGSLKVKEGEAAGPLTLDPPDPARVDVKIRDEAGQPVASRIIVQQGKVDEWWANRLELIPDLLGEAVIFLPAGEYTVQGSKGMEYTYCRVGVTVAEGQTQEATCQIERQLDLTAWTAAQLHVHSEFSIDSQLDRFMRVKGLVAEGMEFWTPTEHDLFEDYMPMVQALDLVGTILPVVGIEVSPVGRHFNGLGCKTEETQLNRYFVIPWTKFLPNGEVSGARLEPDLWKTMHEEFECRMVQVNHPRDGQGYFDLVNYDPAVGPSSALAGRFDLTFDSMEVWNSSDNWDHLSQKTLPDWYSFLNRGRRIIGAGNADTHTLSQWASQPHNLVLVDGALTEQAYFDAMLAGKAQITSAPFVEFSVNGATLGDTVTPAQAGDALSMHIQVSAPEWASLDKVQLIGNGQLVREWDVSGITDLVRLDETIEVTPTEDTWYVILAFDPDTDLSPVYPGRTCAAITNPIWVDVAGDGFDPIIQD